MSDIKRRLKELDDAVRDAAAAVDAARAAGDAVAEAAAVTVMHAAAASRRGFIRSLRFENDRRSMRNPTGR